VLGFVGLGVMGEAMCRNLARKSGARVIAHDVRPAPLAALAADGVTAAASAGEVAAAAQTIFLCLPGEPQVREVCLAAGSLVAGLRAGTPASTTRPSSA
jgi:3-hydroxyisobutyrate dehydrogenase-like beta-hydroxyacid dehydrogenase